VKFELKDPDLVQVQRMNTMSRRKELFFWALGFLKHGTSLATGSPPKRKRFNISVKNLPVTSIFVLD
jgi:hypothetical protein